LAAFFSFLVWLLSLPISIHLSVLVISIIHHQQYQSINRIEGLVFVLPGVVLVLVFLVFLSLVLSVLLLLQVSVPVNDNGMNCEAIINHPCKRKRSCW